MQKNKTIGKQWTFFRNAVIKIECNETHIAVFNIFDSEWFKENLKRAVLSNIFNKKNEELHPILGAS